MKKLMYGALFLAIVGIGVVSCKKTTVEPSSKNSSLTDNNLLKSDMEFNVKTDGKLLIFSSLSDYETLWTPNEIDPRKSDEAVSKFIESLTSLNYSKFKSSKIFSKLKEIGTVEEFPALLFELLNKDGAIQVGSHVFYFDFIGRNAYAIKVEDKENAYSDLISGNSSNSKVKKYNWKDEMILWANDPDAKIGCNEDGAETTEDPAAYNDKIEWEFLLNGNVFQNTFNASVQYKKFDGELKAKYRWTPGGWDLYCKVVVREKTQEGSANSAGQYSYSLNWTTADVLVKLEWQRRYKLKCKEDTGYHTVSSVGNGMATGQSWYGIRACHKYILGANAYAQINGNWELMAFNTPSKNVNGTLYQVRINEGY